MIKQKFNQLTSKAKLLIVLAVTVLANFFMLPLAHVFATTYTTKPIVLLTNMNATGSTSIIMGWIPGSSASTLTLSFPTYTGGAAGAVAASQTVSGSFGGSTCATILGGAYTSAVEPGTPTAAGNASTGLITFTTATQTASTAYCLVLTGSAATNPTSTGVVSAVITAATDGPIGVQVDIITNDQVVVTATVASTFTMSLSGTTDAFTANLSSGTIGATTGVTVTVGTNAKNGWYLYASDLNSGLYSTVQTKTIASVAVGSGPTTISAGAEGYNLAVTSSSITQGSGAGIGTTSAQTYYASSTSGQGGGLNTVPRVIAQSTGTAVNATVPIKEYATISNITPASTDYSDTISLVGAGSF
jgi:hypothetical protein